MAKRRRPGSAPSPGRASTSTTRPVTGAVMRTSCSSLNWTLPVVSSVVTRVLYSVLTTRTTAAGAAGRGRGREVCIQRGQHLQRGRLSHRVDPRDLRLGPGDLALVAVEDPKRQAEAEPDRVVRTDPLVLHLGGDVPPGIRPGQPVIRARPFAVGLCRSEIRPVIERRAHEHGPIQGYLLERELADDVEVGGAVGRPPARSHRT